MRFIFLFVLVNYCGSDNVVDESRYSNKYNEGVDFYNEYENENGFYLNAYNEQGNEKYEDMYRNLNVVGLGEDDREDIVRPCALEDWQCIRNFFAANSNCKPMHGPVPDPLIFERNTVYYSFVNLTVVLNDLRVKGLASSKITEFYVNKDTGNLVFAITFDKLNETSPNAFFRYKRTAKESIVLNDFVTVEYSSGGTFTAVIPKVPNLRLDLAEIHADMNDLVPPYVLGPGTFNSTDPDVLSAVAIFVAETNIAVQEGFPFQAPLLLGIYIQKNICDFGLNLIRKGDREEITRPCSFVDWNCIRNFLAHHSNCVPSYGPVPDPLKLERITQYYPFANLTAIQTRFTSIGLANSKITEFYLNKNTGNIIIAIDFRNLNETSPNAYFRYKRTAKETIVLSDFTTIFYSSGTFTAVIPKIPHLQLHLAEVRADINDALPPFYIGPSAITSTDPDVADALAKFSSSIPTAIREAFLFKSKLYVTIFIQANICYFGSNVISV